jgi:glycosyltransferase involved in cell wall biosynthesis
MRLLIFSSVYPPDPAATGQYLADVATAASARGHSVRVITANRGYDDPSVVFPSYERLNGVEVIRLGWSSFGKKRYVDRIIGQINFTLQGLVKGLLDMRPDVVLVSTIPPLGILAAFITARLKRSSLVYWVMDINPDEAIAINLVRPGSISARLMEFINKVGIKSARTVITLDSRMAKRLESKAELRQPAKIIPPWPHEDIMKKTKAGGRIFRKEHGLEDKFIVMYSGNHSWVHPLDTVLNAAKSLVYRTDIVFLFVGGGVEKHKVEKAIEFGAPNIFSLPYQSFDNLGESLASADVHLVVMGDAMAGIVHPCKIYSAMAAGRPILAIAPGNSYISEIMERQRIGFRYSHGDVAGVIRGILRLADMEGERNRLGGNAARLAQDQYNQILLRNRFVDTLELAACSNG